MRVFACYVVSKLQRHRCPTFGALRLRTKRVQTGRYIFIYIDYGPTPLSWALSAFSVSESYTQSVGFLGRVIGTSNIRYLHTGQHKYKIKSRIERFLVLISVRG
jgi:hypothetical protein